MSASSAGNALFAFPNFAAMGTPAPAFVPGIGNWQPGAQIANLFQKYAAFKARSVNAAAASTQFALDLGQVRAIQVVAIPAIKSLPSAAPIVTVSIYLDQAMTILQGQQTVEVFPVLYPFGSLPFEDPRWLDGRMTDEDATLYPNPVLCIFQTPVIGQVVLVQIVDTANPSAYVELTPPIYVCPGYQGTKNVKWGAQIGWNDPSLMTRTPAGAKIFDKRPKLRTFVAQVDYLPTNESFAQVFDMQARLGITGDFFFSYLPTDSSNSIRTSFPAFATKLDPLTAAALGFQGVAYSIEEKIA